MFPLTNHNWAEEYCGVLIAIQKKVFLQNYMQS